MDPRRVTSGRESPSCVGARCTVGNRMGLQSPRGFNSPTLRNMEGPSRDGCRVSVLKTDDPLRDPRVQLPPFPHGESILRRQPGIRPENGRG
jgi:hypothetical protein